LGGYEVLRDGRLWLDGDDRAVLLPDVLEQGGDQLVSLGWASSASQKRLTNIVKIAGALGCPASEVLWRAEANRPS
jgi:hypothetical protein